MCIRDRELEARKILLEVEPMEFRRPLLIVSGIFSIRIRRFFIESYHAVAELDLFSVDMTSGDLLSNRSDSSRSIRVDLTRFPNSRKGK